MRSSLRIRWTMGALVVLGSMAACGGTEPEHIGASSAPVLVIEPMSSASPPAGTVGKPPVYVTAPRPGAVVAATPIIRVYQDYIPWFGEGRDAATLEELCKTLGVDWFVHPMSDLAQGIPQDTAVVLITSASMGVTPIGPEGLASLDAFVTGGGTLVMDMGDNDASSGYSAPGAIGTPDLVFPTICEDATLAPAARGADGILGTADDHPLVKGPDGIPGTLDDLNDSRIDLVPESCWVAHGNLVDGIMLPPSATTLITASFDGVDKPIVAEYPHGAGRVLIDTTTKEFYSQQPEGVGPSYFMTNFLAYALGITATPQCARPPQLTCPDPVSIECMPDGNTVTLVTHVEDRNGDGLTLTWNVDGSDVQMDMVPPGGPPTVADVSYKASFSPGFHPISVAASDGALVSSCSTYVDIFDYTPPMLKASVTPHHWPADRALVNAGLHVSASDCDPKVAIDVQVFADEDDTQPSAGDIHSPDAKDISPETLRLRRERDQDSDGRVYLIVVRATDSWLNQSVQCLAATIPLRNNPDAESAVAAQAAQAVAYCQASFGAPPPGYVVSGDGPVIGNKQ